jgi:hypothetical protein
MNTFHNEQYTITTSLRNHNIIVRAVNNISCVEYERIFNPRAIGLSFSPAETFTLINKCFTDYVIPSSNLTSKVDIELIQNTGAEHLMVKFYCIVDGFLEMHFIVRLTEKRVAAEGRQNQMIADLTGTVEQMRVEMEIHMGLILKLLEKIDKITRCEEIWTRIRSER